MTTKNLIQVQYVCDAQDSAYAPFIVLNMMEGHYGPPPENDKPGGEFYRKVHDDIKYLFDVDIDYSTIKRFKDIILDSTSSHQALKRALED